MKIVETIVETRKILKSHTQIGFVPTMGALHEGHLALIRKSKAENEITVCSIFVNPTQFNNPDDLLKYPRTFDQDCELLAHEGCDVVFAPKPTEMYETLPILKINFGSLEHIMEGKFRPGHFNGVGIVVSKLFNIVQPQKSYFGQKDIQQVAVVKLLVKDLGFETEIVVCDTIRETDGLAMSSRNRRLSPEARSLAPQIYAALQAAKASLQNGKPCSETKIGITDFFKQLSDFELEYFEIAHFETLEAISTYDKTQKTALIIAAHLGGVRLIDNLVF